jgi:dipeptidyl aminopeptidase/acylaminoacyl peptidase
MTREGSQVRFAGQVGNDEQTRHVGLRSRRLVAGIALGVAIGLLGVPASASAAPPGTAGKIAFASTQTGNFEIWVMNADGTNRSVLTNDPALDQDPDWSPNGKRIAFARVGDGVYTMNADGSDPKRLSAGRGPAWSPDGKRIAFQAIAAPPCALTSS